MNEKSEKTNEEVMLDLSTGEEFLMPKENCRHCLGRGWLNFLPPHKVESEVIKYNRKGKPAKRRQVNKMESLPCECLARVLQKELRRNPESPFKGGKFTQIYDTAFDRQVLVISEKKEEIPAENEEPVENI